MFNESDRFRSSKLSDLTRYCCINMLLELCHQGYKDHALRRVHVSGSDRTVSGVSKTVNRAEGFEGPLQLDMPAIC